MNTENFWDNLPKPFFILAPMEAVTDVVFRHVVAQAAAPDVWFTEFTNATGWVHAGQKAIGGRLVKTDDENPIVAQIWGGEPGDMEQLARHCAELGFHGIDINMGCPAKSAIKSGGSALIRQPELAAQAIAAAKTSGLPVSVKTRLGYTHIDEWREWIAHILRQDIVNFTIHLRTKKEMSKVPAHYELIPEIKKLRDEIAPQTLLTINGDIRDHEHGMELVEKYGVDGVMIGRGIFHNPFAFEKYTPLASFVARSGRSRSIASSRVLSLEPPLPRSLKLDSAGVAPSRATRLPDSTPTRVAGGGAAPAFEEIFDFSKEGADHPAGPGGSDLREPVNDGSGARKNTHTKEDLINLLRLQLDLHDEYDAKMPRKFDPLKRFFKIYIRDFEGAAELRDKLMHTKTTAEVRQLLDQQF